MNALLSFIAFVMLQGILIFISVACFTRKHYVAYYAALYSPVVAFTLVARVRAGDDWLAVTVVQSALSVMYNVYISSSKEQR